MFISWRLKGRIFAVNDIEGKHCRYSAGLESNIEICYIILVILIKSLHQIREAGEEKCGILFRQVSEIKLQERHLRRTGLACRIPRCCVLKIWR